MVVGFEDFVVGEEVGERGEGGVAGMGLQDVGDEEVVEERQEQGVDFCLLGVWFWVRPQRQPSGRTGGREKGGCSG